MTFLEKKDAKQREKIKEGEYMDIEFILKLSSYFIIYSFFGWILESIVKTFIEKKPVNSGFLHGPICPIYGFGAIIMFLFLNSLKGKYIILFIVSFFILSIWEYFVGWALEKVFHTKYWDYTPNRFNIKGRVCLMNSLFWGILGVVFIEWIHPFIDGKLMLVPQNILIFCNVIAYLALLVDFISSVVKVKGFDSKLKLLAEIGENIKEKLEELKNTVQEHRTENIEEMQNVIDELKQKQKTLARKLYKHTIRLKKAFPTMKSENISEFLNQKLDYMKKIGKNKEK